MISVIIPAYNEEKYIEETLKSLQDQTFKNFETIVMCNGCTDNTAKIAKKYTDKVYEIEKNISKARNLGAEKAKNQILIFLDADTLLSKKVLEEISKIKNNFGTCKGKTIENKLRFNLVYATKNSLCKKLRLVNGILFCRKEHFDKVGGYEDIHPFEHKALIKKLKKHGSYTLIKEPIKTSMRRFEKQGLLKSGANIIINSLKKNKIHKEIR